MTDRRIPPDPSASETRRDRPVLAILAIGCAILAFPIAKLAAAVLVRSEDLLGYYGLWTGLLAFLITLAIGITLSTWSFVRREQPRFVSVVAAMANLALVGIVLAMIA